MTAEVRIHTSLRSAVSQTNQAEMNALRARAWIEQKVAVLHIDEISDPWLRQGLINEMVRRHGKRMKR